MDKKLSKKDLKQVINLLEDYEAVLSGYKTNPVYQKHLIQTQDAIKSFKNELEELEETEGLQLLKD